MWVYIIGFIISLFLFYYAEKRKFSGQEAKTCIFFAILIPCLIAGLRSKAIGTDLETYVEPLFQAAERSKTLRAYLDTGYSLRGWDYTAVADFEIGFTLLIFGIQKLFGDMQVLLFVIQALTIIPIYLGLRAFGKTQPVWLGMAVYFLMFFNYSLNMMRQWIAMAWLFYAFHFLMQDKYRKYFIVLAFALLFHATAILGLAIVAIYRLVARENSYGKTVKALMLCGIGVASIFSLEMLTELLKLLGLNYGSYLSGSVTFMPNQIFYRLPILLLMILQWKRFKKTNVYARFYLLMVIFDLLTSQLTSIYSHSARIGVYFSEYYMLAYPALHMTSARKYNRKVVMWFTLAYLCVYWWFIYVYGGTSETVPYQFFFEV